MLRDDHIGEDRLASTMLVGRTVLGGEEDPLSIHLECYQIRNKRCKTFKAGPPKRHYAEHRAGAFSAVSDEQKPGGASHAQAEVTKDLWSMDLFYLCLLCGPQWPLLLLTHCPHQRIPREPGCTCYTVSISPFVL